MIIIIVIIFIVQIDISNMYAGNRQNTSVNHIHEARCECNTYDARYTLIWCVVLDIKIRIG